MTQDTKKKKNSAMRGSRTHGYGSHKKHRGAGSRGGRGMSGTKRQKKTWVLRFKKDHLGKHGFKSLRQRKLKSAIIAVNVCDLVRIAKGKNEINLTTIGISKVLGKGNINASLTVKAKYFTESAKAKIKRAKGISITLGEDNKEELSEPAE